MVFALTIKHNNIPIPGVYYLSFLYLPLREQDVLGWKSIRPRLIRRKVVASYIVRLCPLALSTVRCHSYLLGINILFLPYTTIIGAHSIKLSP